jgi:arylamine N-acetyltransferase
MPRKGQNLDRYIRDAIEHQDALMMGKTPKKARIIDGPLPTRKLMTDALKYLKRLGPSRHFVRDNGKWFEGRANVRNYSQAMYWRRKHRPQPNRCFQNAREYCLAHPESRYFEGYYTIFESTMDHAWIVLEDGMVLDFTHEAVIQKLKKDKGEVHITPPLYLGVEVPHDQLAVLHGSVGPNEPILGLYQKSLRKRRK